MSDRQKCESQSGSRTITNYIRPAMRTNKFCRIFSIKTSEISCRFRKTKLYNNGIFFLPKISNSWPSHFQNLVVFPCSILARQLHGFLILDFCFYKNICLYCFTFCASLKPLTSIYNSFFFPHRPSGTFISCTDWTVKVRK